ncbi:MAG: hypothetical protein K8R86_06455 [Bacteroidales bacterium]|nr:hypothetical protein [Bacteroidales bacterium]
MKNLTISIFAISVIAIITSCSSLKHSYRQVEIQEQSLLVTPVLVDIDVNLEKRVTAVSPKVKGVNDAISTAYYMALEKSGADVIIDPVYKVESGRKKSIATVAGFYGKYSNARKIVDALPEYENLDTNNIKKALMLINGFRMPTTPTVVSETGKQRKKAFGKDK